METKEFRKRLLEAGSALRVLALVGAGAAATGLATPAVAQDYTTGAILGTVTNADGAPVSGASVSLTSQAQGQTRTFTTGPNGTFTAAGLPAGQYTISVTAPGYAQTQDTITVTAAQQSSVTVGLVSTSTTSEIVVTGHTRQVQTQGATGLNIDVQAVNQNAPIPHTITGVTLLAPTAQRGVSAFGDVPSVGGSSVAENAYYINGLNITNPDTYVGSARVPFYFYKNVDVQTGGYAAEFGRATGSVINATSKSGTNDPFIAAHADWQVASLQGHSKNTGDPKNPSDIGNLNEYDSKQLTIEGGAAIIPDHLFVYGLVQPQRNRQEFAAASTKTFTRIRSHDPFWGGKVDAYITPTQHAEFTIFDTRETRNVTAYNFAPNANFTGGTIGTIKGKSIQQTGGLNWVGRYTGDITDWLTLSAAYGINKDAGNTLPSDPNAYRVFDVRSGSSKQISQQPFSSTTIDETKRRFYRADADIRFQAAGSHHVRMGFDTEDLSETKTTDLNGTLPIQYQYQPGYVYLIYEHLGGHVSGRDNSYYIEDSWNTPLDGLTLNFGVRDDIFKQFDLTGAQYANFKNNFGPRFAFSYTPPSMEGWKFFGSYGRYFIPPAMNLGFRGKDLYFQEAFDYPTIAGAPADYNPVTGAGFVEHYTDPITGLPTVNLGAAQPGTAGASDCPIDFSAAPGRPINSPGSCAINGAGIQNPALAKVVPGTKATYEDEFILGARYQVSSLLSVGLSGTYRKLGRVSEDTDFAPQLAAYYCPTATYDPVTGAPTNTAASRCDFYSNNSTYMIWNVSDAKSITVNDWVAARNGQVEPVKLTTGMHFQTPKRTYKAIVLDFNRADDGHWMASGSVTWSKLKGSTEGTVKSDAGNGAQTDAGSTEDFDYLGLQDYGYGLLPNDHRWQFKLFGAYHFNEMFSLGTNIFVQSPMHGSCLGYHPRYPQPDVYDPSYAYGSVSHFCSSGPVNANGYQTATTPSPRGKGWTSDWMKQIDLSARVNVPLGDNDLRKLTFRVDVFNVLNSGAVIQRNAQHESARSGSAATCGAGIKECWKQNVNYLTPLYYQNPRTVRVGVDLSWGGGSPPPPPPVAAPVPAPVEAAPPPPPPPPAPVEQPAPPPPPAPAPTGERG